MLNYDRYLAILAESDASVRNAADSAFKSLLKKIREGDNPRVALDKVLKEFNANTIDGLREALSAIMESAIGVKEIKSYKVGKVKLSDLLYANAEAVSKVSYRIINDHL